MITVVGPKSISLPTALGGDDSLFLLVQVAVSRGLYVEHIGSDRVQLRGITDYSLFTLDIVRSLVAAGADVLGYFVYFEFHEPADPCPFVPGKTWGDAFGPNHRPIQVANRWFQANNMGAPADDGEPLPASLWIDAGVPLWTAEQVAALRPPFPGIA